MNTESILAGIPSTDIPLIITCDGHTASCVSDLNINKENLVRALEDRSDTSRGSTPFADHTNDSTFFALPREPRRRFRGYLFGTKSDVDFQLPASAKTRTISGHHFRIYLNEYYSWMVIDESANGTVVNYEKIASQRMRDKASQKGVTVECGMQVALHPEIPNTIEVGNLLFNVHVHGNPASFYVEDTIEQLPQLGILDLRNPELLSTNFTAALSVYKNSMNQTDYHFLEHQGEPFDEPNLRKLIHKRTGIAAVGKIYSREHEKRGRILFSFLEDVLRSVRTENIISILDSSITVHGFMVVTEYWQATTLETLIESEYLPEAGDIGFMFAQLATALRFLNEHEIIHRDIRPGTILVANERSMSSRLAGFSESCSGLAATDVRGEKNYRAPEMNGSSYDAKVDVYSLSKTAKACFSLVSDSSISDPVANLADIGLTNEPSGRPGAAQLCQSFNIFAGGHYSSPFSFVTASRRFHFHCLSDARREVIVRTNELFEAICACSRFRPSRQWLKQDTWEISSKETDFDGIYCTFHDANRLFSRCKLFELGLNIPSRASHSNHEKTFFELENTAFFKIYYHAPSSMINFTQLQQIIGPIGLRAIPEDLIPSKIQEVHGFEELKGNYIDMHSFELIHEHLQACEGLDFSVRMEDIRPVDAPLLCDRFTDVDSSQYIILATKRIIPDLILLNRDDCSVSKLQVEGDENACGKPLKPPFLMPEEATSTLECRGLGALGGIIRQLAEKPRTFDWKTFDRQTSSESDCESESTVASSTAIPSFTHKRKRE